MNLKQHEQLKKAGQPISDSLFSSDLQKANFASGMYSGRFEKLTPFGQRCVCAVIALALALSCWLVLSQGSERPAAGENHSQAVTMESGR